MNNKINVNWNKNPEIQWVKKLCPLCEEPTGEESQCENLKSKFKEDEEEDQGIKYSKTIEKGGSFYPLFTKQCFFKRYNTYVIYTNYPLSSLVVQKISSVEGVEKIEVETSYRAEISIAPQFEETEVKKNVSNKYRDTLLRIKDAAKEFYKDND